VTKLHEEFRRGKLSELSASLEERPRAAKITLLIALKLPPTRAPQPIPRKASPTASKNSSAKPSSTAKKL